MKKPEENIRDISTFRRPNIHCVDDAVTYYSIGLVTCVLVYVVRFTI